MMERTGAAILPFEECDDSGLKVRSSLPLGSIDRGWRDQSQDRRHSPMLVNTF
jgi:hypothetical protein